MGVGGSWVVGDGERLSCLSAYLPVSLPLSFFFLPLFARPHLQASLNIQLDPVRILLAVTWVYMEAALPNTPNQTVSAPPCDE